MKIFWRIYSFIFYAIVISNAIQLLNKNSMLGVYYNTTIVFSGWYIVPYFMNILNGLIACIVCLFIYGYAFNIRGLTKAPLWLLFLRFLSESTGHSYEIKMIQSIIIQAKFLGFIAIASMILPIIPSYIAQWRLTFNQK